MHFVLQLCRFNARKPRREAAIIPNAENVSAVPGARVVRTPERVPQQINSIAVQQLAVNHTIKYPLIN
jgi:hypothetical protein